MKQLSGMVGQDYRPGVPAETFFGIVTDLVGSNVKNLRHFLTRNGIWLLVLAALWLFLMTYPTARMPKVGALLIFLTVAYNNWIAKALYIGIIHAELLPRAGRIRQSGLAGAFPNFGSTLADARVAFTRLGDQAVKVFLLYCGAGLIAANALTRNDKSDKYFICLLIAYTLWAALASGEVHLLVRLFRAGFRGITGHDPGPDLTAAAFVSFGAGLILSFIPGLLSNQYWDYKGYIMGAALMGLAFVPALLKRNHGQKPV